jgi:hypothetical protein
MRCVFVPSRLSSLCERPVQPAGLQAAARGTKRLWCGCWRWFLVKPSAVNGMVDS